MRDERVNMRQYTGSSRWVGRVGTLWRREEIIFTVTLNDLCSNTRDACPATQHSASLHSTSQHCTSLESKAGNSTSLHVCSLRRYYSYFGYCHGNVVHLFLFFVFLVSFLFSCSCSLHDLCRLKSHRKSFLSSIIIFIINSFSIFLFIYFFRY